MPNSEPIRVGTRESQLARLQTDMAVRALQAKFPDHHFEIVPITSYGDKVQDKPIADLGTRGVFVKELEYALFDNKVDFVVHSLKDLPTDMPDGLFLAAVLHRADPRDVIVSHNNIPFAKLPAASKVATSSRRRMAQLKAIRNDIEFVDMRGNIQTRFRKHDEGQCDAMVLAAAGLLRLEMNDRITEFLSIDLCTPAAGQGALAIESRANDERMRDLLAAIDDEAVRAQSTAERHFLDRLGGGCSVPIGALAESIEGAAMRMTGCVAALDGAKVLRATIVGTQNKARELGDRMADKLLEMGAETILVALRQSQPNAISAP